MNEETQFTNDDTAPSGGRDRSGIAYSGRTLSRLLGPKPEPRLRTWGNPFPNGHWTVESSPRDGHSCSLSELAERFRNLIRKGPSVWDK